MSFDMGPIKKKLAAEIARLQDTNFIYDKRIEWLNKDLIDKQKEKKKIRETIASNEGRIRHLEKVMKGAKD